MKIEFRNVTMKYGEKTAVNAVSFTLEDGVYGLLGPNGAGKSTIMNLITGNLKPVTGEILMDGKPVGLKDDSWRTRIGYMPQIQTFYPDFTAMEFMYYVASLKDMSHEKARKQIIRLLKQLDLYEVRRNRIRTYSGGMKQRLLLAQALLNDPELLILDEPTAGMDPKQRVVVSGLIGELSLNRTVLISTHVVSDIEYIAKEIILLKDGMILKKEPVSDLCRSITGKVFEVQMNDEELGYLKEDNDKTVVGIAKDAGGIRARIIRDDSPAYRCSVTVPTLDDVYMYYFREEAVHVL